MLRNKYCKTLFILLIPNRTGRCDSLRRSLCLGRRTQMLLSFSSSLLLATVFLPPYGVLLLYLRLLPLSLRLNFLFKLIEQASDLAHYTIARSAGEA